MYYENVDIVYEQIQFVFSRYSVDKIDLYGDKNLLKYS